jgi:pimeloyl-ACP methyl ester carboxylesterase/catechol 2,3-dioxygenase-like lactoylglutathione lyase family enzyme
MIPALPASRFATVGGLRLHYLDFGGDGPAAVLHHGTGFHAWVWEPIARLLSHRYRVLAIDARGHGDSDKPVDGYRWQRFIDDLIGFVDALGVHGGLGIGHSLGGATTASAAAQQPDLFSAVVLLDPILVPREPRPAPGTDNPMSAMARRRREVWNSTTEAFESYRGRGPFAAWPDAALRLYVDHGFRTEDGGVRLKCPPQIEAQVFGMSQDFDSWSAIDRLAVPALVMRGGDSPAFSAGDAERVAKHLRHGRVRTLEASSHTFPMERPDEVAAAILEFTDSILPLATRGLAHVALNVRRLEDTERFYREVFGMRVVWRPDADNVYLSSGRDNLALHRTHAERTANGSPLDHLGFFVDAPERVFTIAETLERAAVPIVKPPRHHRDGSCSVYVADPDGNVVQILYDPNASRR